MLDQSQPIELTHEGILLDKTGRKWSAGKYPPNTVPFELTEDVRGENFLAQSDQDYSKVPALDSESGSLEPAKLTSTVTTLKPIALEPVKSTPIATLTK